MGKRETHPRVVVTSFDTMGAPSIPPGTASECGRPVMPAATAAGLPRVARVASLSDLAAFGAEVVGAADGSGGGYRDQPALAGRRGGASALFVPCQAGILARSFHEKPCCVRFAILHEPDAWRPVAAALGDRQIDWLSGRSAW